MNKQQPPNQDKKNVDWAKNAEDALKKAENDIANIKKEAQEELNNHKTQSNDLDDH